MAQPQQVLKIDAPGFHGINTEDSPYGLDTSFCLQADNAIIDQNGRIGAREAFATHTTLSAVTLIINELATSETKEISQVGVGTIDDIVHVVGVLVHKQYSSADLLIQTDHYLVVDAPEQTPAGDQTLLSIPFPTLTDETTLDKASIIAFNNAMYIFSKGNAALKYDGTNITELFTGTVDVDYIPAQDDTGVIAAEMDGDIALSAYGRIWTTGVNNDYNTIYYSDMLIPTTWYDGKATPTDTLSTAGILDIGEYWPSGGDRIVGMAAHNNFLIVFGRQSILVYANAATGDPAGDNGITLQDTISNIGAVSRDGIVSTGSDILFVDDSGVRSLGRTIQEKSVPLGDLTYNVRYDITEVIKQTKDKSTIQLAYLPDKDITVCLFPEGNQAYVMEMRAPSSTGGHKMTRWTECVFNRIAYVERGGDVQVLLGSTTGDGYLKYDGYTQYNNRDYQFQWGSTALTFGDSSTLKFLKKLSVTLVSRKTTSEGTLQWGFDGYLTNTSKFDVEGYLAALFGEEDSAYGVALFGAAPFSITRYRKNVKGSGNVIRVGHTNKINGNPLSIQEILIQTTIGRVY
jgi:hypothetical protein